MYKNDIHEISANLKFILYADNTTITSPLCSFTHGDNDHIMLKKLNSRFSMIIEELSQQTKYQIW